MEKVHKLRKMKISNSSGILRTPNHDGSFLLLFGKRKLQSFEISLELTAWKLFVFGVILVRIFPHSNWIRRDTPYLSVFSSNAEKCGPE